MGARRRLFLCLLLACLSLTACGAGDSETSEPSAGSENGAAASEGGEPPSPESEVEGFGSEASGSERASVLAAEHGYLVSLGSGAFAEACRYLSGSVARSLGELTASGGEACPAILPQVLSRSALAEAGRQARIAVRKVRVRGKQAFVVYHAPGARLYVLPMQEDNGAWRVGAVAANILAPSLESIGNG
jgi:hypothetical protein